jgi:hypothetical protein
VRSPVCVFTHVWVSVVGVFCFEALGPSQAEVPAHWLTQAGVGYWRPLFIDLK